MKENHIKDDSIRALFTDFDPPMESDARFVARLERNLDAVESVRRQSLALKARSRRAVALAAAAGFLVGFIFSLALPYVGAALEQWCLSVPSSGIMAVLADNYMLPSWLLIAATSVTVAVNTYEFSLSRGSKVTRSNFSSQ